MNSKAIVFVRPETVELGEVPLPAPTSSDLLVETLVSGVSVGTERWAWLGKRAEIRFPNVPGYMAVGRVLETGADAAARGYKNGDLVYYFASKLAGEFEGASWMSSHLSHAVVDVCNGVEFNRDALDVHRCERVPAGADPRAVVLAGLGAVAMRGIEMAVIPAGAKVLVAGLGVIGQFAAQICRLKGAEVAVTDRVVSRLKIAADNGADWVIDATSEDLAARSREIAPLGYDIIIDTTSSAAVVNSLFPLLRMRGKFVFQGWYPPPTPLDLNALHQRLPTCFSPCAHSGTAVKAVMQWIADGHIKTGNFITHDARPAQAPEIYKMIGAGSENFLGVLFDWR
ncbi:zinc-dependent alcohol dehydrogenase [Geminisphaera colitermitum]|uniref:zinc-dependent alcohol dehydrogenase n=1 Tax=Geminisphaera colitermitum TaxID=1148786 RepID=UPI000158CC00|nr:zinc-binding alcohol dehydrogenase [Geminisphaera colitermitum]